MPDLSQNSSVTTKFSTDEDGNPILEIPEELLEVLDWREEDEIEISVFVDRLLFRKIAREKCI